MPEPVLLPEDEVYEGAKATLRALGWTIFAGQPPSGNDAFPVAEIKLPGRTKLGSEGAFKPDLLAHNGGVLLIVECKPAFSAKDEAKLLSVLLDAERVGMLMAELVQRNLFVRRQIIAPPGGFRFAGALAYSGPPGETALGTIEVANWRSAGRFQDPQSAYRLSEGEVMVEPY
jgi:hypothetical protein